MFEEIKKTVRNLPLQIGNEAEVFFKDNFNKQGFDDDGLDKWVERKHPVPGRNILTKSGRLKKEIRKQVIGLKVMVKVMGASEKYADIHNFGGTITIRVTDKLRKYAWKMWYATGAGYWKGIALTKKSTLTIKMPQRKFIGASRTLDRKISALIEKQLGRIQ